MHFLKPEHLKTICPSCAVEKDRIWKSEWWDHIHYLRTNCDCGYKIIRKTSNFRSGHFHEYEL